MLAASETLASVSVARPIGPPLVQARTAAAHTRIPVTLYEPLERGPSALSGLCPGVYFKRPGKRKSRVQLDNAGSGRRVHLSRPVGRGKTFARCTLSPLSTDTRVRRGSHGENSAGPPALGSKDANLKCV
ncbi:hypothetical protein MRX96_057900 [Rhipicephalus microplus]